MFWEGGKLRPALALNSMTPGEFHTLMCFRFEEPHLFGTAYLPTCLLTCFKYAGVGIDMVRYVYNQALFGIVTPMYYKERPDV